MMVKYVIQFKAEAIKPMFIVASYYEVDENRVLNVSISDQAYSLGDKSTLEVLIAAAINDAMQKLETSKLSQAQDFGGLFGQNV